MSSLALHVFLPFLRQGGTLAFTPKYSQLGRECGAIIALENSWARKKVVVVGQGYVGLPVAIAAVSSGHQVVGIDNNPGRVAKIMSGISPVEDIADRTIVDAISKKAYVASTEYRMTVGFEVAVVSVPTPLMMGQPDMSFIENAMSDLAPWVTRGSTVILESTTYPGTTEELAVPILEKGSGLKAGKDFFVGYSPERIDPGNKVWTLVNTPKIVAGVDEDSLRHVTGFYESLGIPVVPVSGTREAEMTKLLENTFRHVNIALVNELAMFSHQLGVDIWEAIAAAETKPFGFMRFDPGPGVGGHCLPVDPSFLSWAIREKAAADFRFVSLANDVNDSMASFVVDRSARMLQDVGTPIYDSRCLVVGLAYKPGTGDIRESPSIEIVRLLKELGANVSALDDYVGEDVWPHGVEKIHDGATLRFDMAIVLTNHPGVDLNWVSSASKQVLDTRNSVSGLNVVAL